MAGVDASTTGWRLQSTRESYPLTFRVLTRTVSPRQKNFVLETMRYGAFLMTDTVWPQQSKQI